MKKRISWKSRYEKVQSELNALNKLHPQIEDSKKFQLTIIKIERIHYAVAICIAFLTSIQAFLFFLQNNLVQKQLEQIELQNGLFKKQNEQIELQNTYASNQTDLMSIQKDQIDIQNELIKNQTNKLEQQTILLESSRRSSRISLMSNVLDKMDDELKGNEDRSLSKELSARIIALSNSFKPYYILEKDIISQTMLSPERGQFLVALVKSNLDAPYFSKTILTQSDFSFSDLREVDLRNATLTNTRLNNSNFSKAVLTNADFTLSTMKRCNFSGADLTNANFKSAILSYANFENADLTGAKFEGSVILGVNIKGANCDESQKRILNPANSSSNN